MMRRLLGSGVTMAICFGTLTAWAAPVSKEATVNELMTLSGIEHTLQQIPKQVLAGFAQQGRKLPVEQHQALRRALVDAFDVPMMQRHVATELQTNLRPEVMAKTMEWLRSDLGRKMTALENAAGDPRSMQDLQAFMKRLEKTPPTQERLQLIRRLDMATNSTELLLDITESITVSLASAHDATLPATQRIGADRIRVQISRERGNWRPQAQNHVLVTMLYTYRAVGQQELEQYVGFLETEAGLDYCSQTSGAFKGAMDLGIQRATSAMMDILKPPAGRKAI